jgi:hypothetical protein
VSDGFEPRPYSRDLGCIRLLRGRKAIKVEVHQNAHPMAELSPSSLFFAGTGGRLS